MNKTTQRIIELLGLQPLPVEGGFFRQTYISSEKIESSALPGRYGRQKPFGTAIYYLLTSDSDSFSALHRLPTDEVYHFYLGDPVEMVLLFRDGKAREVILGPDLGLGQHLQFVVPGDVWQGSRLLPGGSYALLGTTMAPGFDPADYEPGTRKPLTQRYPEYAERIALLTRDSTEGQS